MSGVMVDMDAVILGGLCSHGGFGIYFIYAVYGQ